MGVFLEQNLRFQEEVKSILKKLACAIKTLSVVKKGLPINTRSNFVNALVLSQLLYLATNLVVYRKTQYFFLEKQLSWALKTCSDRRKYNTSSDLKLKVEILPVSFFLKSKIIVFCFKISQSKIAPYRNLNFPNSQIIK